MRIIARLHIDDMRRQLEVPLYFMRSTTIISASGAFSMSSLYMSGLSGRSAALNVT